MKLTLDVENTTTERNGKLHLDPFEPDNSLTMIGLLTDTGEETIVTFDHNDVEANTRWVQNSTGCIRQSYYTHCTQCSI